MAIAALVAVGGIVAFLLLRGGEGPEAALDGFLTAYEEGDYAAAAARTDGDPAEVAEALEANVDGLDGAALEAEVESLSERDGDARASVTMRWDVPDIGEFDYDNDRVRLTKADDEWLIEWRETVVHPELDAEGLRLGTEAEAAERAPILARDGRALVRPRPVVEVGVIPKELRDREAAVAAIAEHTGADAETLAASIDAAAEPTNFVPAITLREEEFAEVEDELEPIRGIEFGRRELPLAPTKEFARALLGAVGPVTAEQLRQDEGLETGDVIGQWGLQAEFDDRLAGEPTRRVVARRADGVPVEVLMETGGAEGEPLETTLDLAVQLAAEKALAGTEGKAALVALDASGGDILAAANRPVDDTFDRALEGQYPPGSTFKVVTTAALLDGGLSPDETVDCPATIDVGGKLFRNFEGSAAGAVPFSVDFAESCNTAFVSLVDRLAPDGLERWGTEFGLGRKYELAVPAFSGSVPPGRDEVEEAASMIGQGRILASPLAMAGVAATIEDGRWRRPRLLADDPVESGEPLPTDLVATLRELMRDVVVSGTGTALAGAEGEPIGKSGTAEYGSGDPPPTHAWFIAARAGIAIAVLVEDRPSGGEFAAPVAADFFAALDAGGAR
ncbi:MAG TPA: penicillin-binding transpeptidase domain-containing protein [Solirubrobacterales bacterium]